jgi:hypothetical protein
MIGSDGGSLLNPPDPPPPGDNSCGISAGSAIFASSMTRKEKKEFHEVKGSYHNPAHRE